MYSAVQIFKKEGELIVGEEEEKEEKKEEEESLGTYRICSGLETRFLLVRNGFE